MLTELVSGHVGIEISGALTAQPMFLIRELWHLSLVVLQLPWFVSVVCFLRTFW